MTSRSITMSKEIEEMEMMDRQFNNRGGGDSMFTRRRQMQMEMESHKMIYVFLYFHHHPPP